LLEELGIDTNKITEELQEGVESQYGIYYGFSDQVYVSSGLSYVLELARREARLFNQKDVGPLHFLLGLLREGRSQAAQILRKHGVDYERLLQKAKEKSEELAAEGSLLNLYATDLTKMAKEGKIGPIIG